MKVHSHKKKKKNRFKQAFICLKLNSSWFKATAKLVWVLEAFKVRSFCRTHATEPSNWKFDRFQTTLPFEYLISCWEPTGLWLSLLLFCYYCSWDSFRAKRQSESSDWCANKNRRFCGLHFIRMWTVPKIYNSCFTRQPSMYHLII